MTQIKTTTRFIAGLVALSLALLAAPAMAADTGKVNLNTATAEQLALLPRVGPAVAQRILEHREKNGNFKNPEELLLVRGIGEKTFELIAPYVSLSGPTTLTAKVRAAKKPAAEPAG